MQALQLLGLPNVYGPGLHGASADMLRELKLDFVARFDVQLLARELLPAWRGLRYAADVPSCLPNRAVAFWCWTLWCALNEELLAHSLLPAWRCLRYAARIPSQLSLRIVLPERLASVARFDLELLGAWRGLRWAERSFRYLLCRACFWGSGTRAHFDAELALKHRGR